MKHQENVTHLDGLTFEYEVEAVGSDMVELPEYVLIDGTRYIPERTCEMEMVDEGADELPSYYRNYKCSECGEINSHYKYDWFSYCPHCGAKVIKEE